MQEQSSSHTSYATPAQKDDSKRNLDSDNNAAAQPAAAQVSPPQSATAQAVQPHSATSPEHRIAASGKAKGNPFRKRKPGKALPPPTGSHFLLITLAPADTGMFRFLLEACDNLAYFTVLEKDTALLRLIYSPHCEKSVRRALDDIAQTVPLTVEEWPFPPISSCSQDESPHTPQKTALP